MKVETVILSNEPQRYLNPLQARLLAQWLNQSEHKVSLDQVQMMAKFLYQLGEIAYDQFKANCVEFNIAEDGIYRKAS